MKNLFHLSGSWDGATHSKAVLKSVSLRGADKQMLFSKGIHSYHQSFLHDFYCMYLMSSLFAFLFLSQVSVEVLVEYPFFVFGQGWSSCCPERTTQLLELPCTKLSVGDVCISLTLKNLRNGSIKKSQGQVLDAPSLGPPLKSPKALSSGMQGGVRHTEQENGLGQCGDQGRGGGQDNRENGELRFGERDICKAPPVTESESGSKPTGRKRRWSAPEGRKVEYPEGEPPLKFPKPSFIPREVKISIEGRSNIGKWMHIGLSYFKS